MLLNFSHIVRNMHIYIYIRLLWLFSLQHSFYVSFEVNTPKKALILSYVLYFSLFFYHAFKFWSISGFSFYFIFFSWRKRSFFFNLLSLERKKGNISFVLVCFICVFSGNRSLAHRNIIGVWKELWEGIVNHRLRISYLQFNWDVDRG